MEDWSGGNSCFDHAMIGGGRDMDERQRFRWFLGIDVSKETFDACCIPSHGERLFILSASVCSIPRRVNTDPILSTKDTPIFGADSTHYGSKLRCCSWRNLLSNEQI